MFFVLFFFTDISLSGSAVFLWFFGCFSFFLVCLFVFGPIYHRVGRFFSSFLPIYHRVGRRIFFVFVVVVFGGVGVGGDRYHRMGCNSFLTNITEWVAMFF